VAKHQFGVGAVVTLSIYVAAVIVTIIDYE